MPACRHSITQAVKIGGTKGIRIYMTIGFYDQERTRVGEVWLVMAKTGSFERALLDANGIAASKRLQRGEPLEELAEDWLGMRFAPCGPVIGDARIKNCSSILDYVARHLLIYYCGRNDLAHVPAAPLPTDA